MKVSEGLSQVISPVNPDTQREHWAIWATIAVIAAGLMISDFFVLDRPAVTTIAGLVVVACLGLRVRRPGLAVVLGFGANLAVHPIAAFRDVEITNSLEADLLVLVLLWNALRWMEKPLSVLALAAFAGIGAPAIEALNPAWTWSRTTENAVIYYLVIGFALLVRFARWQQHQLRQTTETQQRHELASNLHDSAAHHMSAIAIRVEAAAAMTPPGSELHEALSQIKSSASAALDDVRQLVGGLRTGDNSSTELPGLGDIATLCADSSDGRVTVYAEIGVDDRLVAPRTAATAYFIVREAVTNSLRHATALTTIDVQVHLSGGVLEVTILDDGRSDLGEPDETRGTDGLRAHYGVSGMTERAQALGGTLTAGPIRTGGWLVNAKLPVRAE